MPVYIVGLLEDVNCYKTKDGNFGANVTISQKIGRKTKRLTFNLKSEDKAHELENYLDVEIKVLIALDQSNFGLRFGDIMLIEEIKDDVA